MGGGGKRLGELSRTQDLENPLLDEENNTDGKCPSLDVGLEENNTTNEDGGDDDSSTSDGEQREIEPTFTNFPNIHDNTTSNATVSVSRRTFWVSVFLFLCALGVLAGVVVVQNNKLGKFDQQQQSGQLQEQIQNLSEQIKNLSEKTENLSEQTENLSEQTKNIKNSLDTVNKTLATSNQKIEDLDNNKVSYDSDIILQSDKGGKLTDIQNGYGRFQNELNPDPNENETMKLKIEKNLR